MLRLRRVTALLSASFLLQWMLVGSGVLCGTQSTARAQTSERQLGAGRTVHAAHAMRSPATRARSMEPATSTRLLDLDGCPGMTGHGCGAPSAPSSSQCVSMDSCASTAAALAPSLVDAFQPTRLAVVLQTTASLPFGTLGPEPPPPRA